jgi:hypothetical protein
MQLGSAIAGSLGKFVAEPVVSVIVREVHSVKVTVIGEVKTPGRYECAAARRSSTCWRWRAVLSQFAAHGRITILRAEGDTFRQLPFDFDKVTTRPGPASASQLNFCVRPGDIIVVPEAVSQQSAHSNSLNMDLALQAWRRRSWVALIVFAASAARPRLSRCRCRNLYSAVATVLVERQEVSEAFVRPSVTAELETRLQTIREAVMSRTQLTDLIRRLDLYPDMRPTVPVESLVGRMRKETKLDIKGVESQTSGRTSTIAFTLTYSRARSRSGRARRERARRHVCPSARCAARGSGVAHRVVSEGTAGGRPARSSTGSIGGRTTSS